MREWTDRDEDPVGESTGRIGSTTPIRREVASIRRHGRRRRGGVNRHSDPGSRRLVRVLAVTLALLASVTVSGAIVGAADDEVSPVVAGIAATGLPTVNGVTSFNVIATSPAGLDLSYAWDFGDGTSGTGRSVDHVYTAAGAVTATVVVSDGDGNSTTMTKDLTVGSTPEVSSDGTGRQYWLTFNNNNGGAQDLQLFIAASTAATGTVEVPGIAFSETFSVAAGGITTVDLPLDGELPLPSGISTVESLGIAVNSDVPVTIYGLSYKPFTTDAYLGLPTAALGTDYRVLSYPSSFSPQEVAIVATRNATEVTVTPNVTLGVRPAGVSFVETLDIGEVLVLPSPSNFDEDMSGTAITSNYPIGVFTGNSCANVPPSSPYCDHLVEQMTPTTAWGRKFVTTPLTARTNGDTFRVLAATDGTEVRIDGTTVATLDDGQVYETILEDASLLEATEPVMVAQFANGSTFSGNPGDPFMMIVPPYEQFLASYTLAAPASGFEQSYVNLVVSSNDDVVTLDGAPLSADLFTVIEGSGFSFASVPVDPGTHRLWSQSPFGLSIYGFNDDESYGYTGGMSLSSVATVNEIRLILKGGSALVGQEGCVVGTALDSNGVPVSGVRVDFSITGVHEHTGFMTTNAVGEAEFCYVGERLGTDTVTATVSGRTETMEFAWTNPPPIAVVSVDRFGGNAPLDVTFDGSGSSAFQGDIVSYEWDFGDGTTAVGVTALHTYTDPGMYEATLTVTDEDGSTATDTLTIEVTGSSTDPLAPTAVAVADPVSGDAPLVVTFDGSGSSDPDGGIVSFEWDFGDGTTGVGETTSHTYAEPGAYTVTLTVTDEDGLTGTDSLTVTVTEPTVEPQGGAISIEISGAYKYVLDGNASDGSFKIVTDKYGVKSIKGTVTVDGARVKIKVERLWNLSIHLGVIVVDDPANGIKKVEAPILQVKLRKADGDQPAVVSGSASWFNLKDFRLTPYKIKWSFADTSGR